MAISTVGSSDNFTPAYNPIYWYFDSDNKSKPGFKYIVDVYEITGTASQSLIKTMRISPRPIDGYCEVELSKTLQNYVTHQLPTDSTPIDAEDSYIGYNLEIGEEYNVQWDYDAYYDNQTGVFTGSFAITTNPSTGGGSLVEHPYSVGQQIIISQSDNGVAQPTLEGLFTIDQIVDIYTIVVGAQFVGDAAYPTGLLPGVTTYSNNSKTQFLNLKTITNKTAFNGVVSHFNFLNYSNGTFAPNISNPTSLLTNMPTTFTVLENSTIVLNLFTNGDDTITERVVFTNSLGTIREADITISPTPKIKALGVGGGNLMSTTYVSGPVGGVIETGVEWYEFYVDSDSNDASSKTYRFNIDSNCSKHPTYEVMFLDRLGSLGSFFFKYKSQISTSIERTQQKFILGAFDFDAWAYTASDYGTKTIDTNIKENINVNTAWLSEAESTYFQEFLSSPVAYIKINDLYWACSITNTSSKWKTLANEKVIKYSATIELANNDNINY